MVIKCYECGIEKDESEFHVNRASETGRNIRCKICVKAVAIRSGRARAPGWAKKTEDIVAYRRQWRAKNIDKFRGYDKKRYELYPEYYREKGREKYARKMRLIHGADWAPGEGRKTKLTEEQRKMVRAARNRRKYAAGKKKYPERYAAKQVIKWAVARGVASSQPCWECGFADTEAHHPAYSLPLDVVWLCRKHHLQLHREFRKK